MRRTSAALFSIAGLALALAAAGCGGSASVTSSSEPSAFTPGSAAVQGTVTGATDGLSVAVVGTPLTANLDEEGQFALWNVPAGTITLRFQGPTVDARLAVTGVQDHQVTTLHVTVSGTTAQNDVAPNCGPTAETFFTGQIDSINGTQLVVSGRPVDASQVNRVWRGNHRINLEDLRVGEKVKIWGTLRPDGSALADEIWALTEGDETWITFSGRIESISDGAAPVAACVYPTLVVSGTTVYTNGNTAFKRSDGSSYDASVLAVGMAVYVEGWKKADGSVRATLVRL
jgi:hypothetical protein